MTQAPPELTIEAQVAHIKAAGTPEQVERLEAILARLDACWQTEAQDEADHGRIEELHAELEA